MVIEIHHTFKIEIIPASRFHCTTWQNAASEWRSLKVGCQHSIDFSQEKRRDQESGQPPV